MTDCDKHIEWKFSSTGSSLHVYVKEEKWKLSIALSMMERSELECAIIMHDFLLGDRGAQRNVRSTFRLHPRIATSCLSSRTRPPRNWWLNTPATVGLCLYSDAILDVFDDFIFTALELSALKRGLSGLPMNRITQ